MLSRTQKFAISATLMVVMCLCLGRHFGNGGVDHCVLSLADGSQVCLLRYSDATRTGLSFKERIFGEQYLIMGLRHPDGVEQCMLLDVSDYEGFGFPVSLAFSGNQIRIRNGVIGRGVYDLTTREGTYAGRRIELMATPDGVRNRLFRDRESMGSVP